MILAEEIEQAAAPMAGIVACRAIRAGEDDDAPLLRRRHGRGLAVTGLIRAVRRSLRPPCRLRLRIPRLAARIARRRVARWRLVDGPFGGLARRRGDDAFFRWRGIR